MADDLDDGLDYAMDSIGGSVMLSDAEGASDDDAVYYNNNSEGEEEEFSTASNSNLRKRKVLEDDDEDSDSEIKSKQTSKGSQKKKKKSNTDKFSEKKQLKQQTYAEQRRNLASLSPSMVADYLASKVRRRLPDLSTIELGDLYLKEASIASTEDFDASDRQDEKYPEFMEQYFKDILKEHQESDTSDKAKADDSKKSKKKNKKGKGEPAAKATAPPRYILVLASSAIRVCDINRALRTSRFGSFKLIKKNKLGYDVHMFETGKSRIAVATVGRIERLLDMDPKQYPDNEKTGKDGKKDGKENKKCLEYTQIGAIVVDSTFLDKKEQHTWDLPETIPFVKKVIDKCVELNGAEDEAAENIPKVFLF